MNRSDAASDRRTVGYHFAEKVLPVEHDLYVLGEFADTSDGLVIRKPSDGDKPFVVSLKSEQELTMSAQSSAKWMQIFGIGLVAVGVVLAVIGVLR